jgi:hypothetical protein
VTHARDGASGGAWGVFGEDATASPGG